jgi:SRSO17 transposase
MKPLHDTTDPEIRPSLQEIGRWPLALIHLHQRLALRFARPEPRRHALLYLQAIISEIPRKNGWQIAEHAKQLRPYGIQRLLSHAVWDEEGVRDDLRRYVFEQLYRPDDAFLIGVLDESGFPKRGHKSAGVKKQHCGVSGRVENCQVGVFLSYVTTLGHALIDRDLYLPEDWLNDRERCQQAGIAETVPFRPKWELALEMLKRAREAGLPMHWVVADTVYGQAVDLRNWLEHHGYAFVLAIACDEPVCVATPSGGCLLAEAAEVDATLLHEQDWQRLSMSQGSKGPRLFDWAILPLLHRGVVDSCHWLLIRRCIDDPNEKAYYLVFAPPGVSLQTMVQAIGARWSIEVDLENSKDLGLDQYEVRSYVGWYRHVTLVLLAYAFLVGICIHDTCQHEHPSPPVPLIPLTPSEARHLLARLTWPAPSQVILVLAWSQWRRLHAYWASHFHTRRRLDSG